MENHGYWNDTMQIFVVACICTEEGHTPPGSPQGKFLLLKINKNSKRKYQQPFWNSPEILDSKGKSQIGCAARVFQYETNEKESRYLDL